MKKLILTIKNNTPKTYKNVQLLGYGETLPDGIQVDGEFREKGKIIKLTYPQVIAQFNNNAELANVIKSTNNRQLHFWIIDPFGSGTSPMPSLTIDRKPRPKKYFKCTDEDGYTYTDWEYKTQWNPKKWNIADTKEAFRLDIYTNILLTIKRGQTFIIEFKIHPRPFRPIPAQFINMPTFTLKK